MMQVDVVAEPSIAHWRDLQAQMDAMWDIYLEDAAGQHVESAHMPSNMLQGIYPGYRDVELLHERICAILNGLPSQELTAILQEAGKVFQGDLREISAFQQEWIRLGNINMTVQPADHVYDQAKTAGQLPALTEYLAFLRLLKWFQVIEENQDYTQFLQAHDLQVLARIDLTAAMRLTVGLLNSHPKA